MIHSNPRTCWHLDKDCKHRCRHIKGKKVADNICSFTIGKYKTCCQYDIYNFLDGKRVRDFREAKDKADDIMTTNRLVHEELNWRPLDNGGQMELFKEAV